MILRSRAEKQGDMTEVDRGCGKNLGTAPVPRLTAEGDFGFREGLPKLKKPKVKPLKLAVCVVPWLLLGLSISFYWTRVQSPQIKYQPKGSEYQYKKPEARKPKRVRDRETHFSAHTFRAEAYRRFLGRRSRHPGSATSIQQRAVPLCLSGKFLRVFIAAS